MIKPSEDLSLIETVKATAEIYGRQISLTAATMFLVDLDNFSAGQIKQSLSRCRKELRTYPTVADVIARVEDGHPGVEEAWAMIPKDEASSVVWTEQMREAFGVCYSLLEQDQVAARMAFKEKYTAVVADARAKNLKISWSPSLGYNKSGRAAAIVTAFQKGRITNDHANSLLCDMSIPMDPKVKQLVSGAVKNFPIK